MKHHGRLWYILIGLFYASLLLFLLHFFSQVNRVEQVMVDQQVQSDFAGNDWVVWEDTERGVIAQSVHPLLKYKSFGTYRSMEINRIEEGDRLLKIGGIHGMDVVRSEMVDRYVEATPPGEVEQFFVESVNAIGISGSESRMIRNGFRLSFTFNRAGTFWQISLWLIGFGTFISVIALFILLPIIQGNIRNNRAMLGLVSGALLFFLVQLFRHLYLIVESDLEGVGLEKAFIIAYAALLFVYVVNYFHIKAEAGLAWFSVPSFVVGGILLAKYVEIVYFSQHLRFFHDLIEHTTYLFFCLHIFGAIGLYLVKRYSTDRSLELRHLLSLVGIGGVALAGIWYFGWGYRWVDIPGEQDVAIYNLLVFFPLVNSAFLQLQFGKVRFVVTLSLQYLFFFLFSVALFLLINQLYDYWLFNNPYQRMLSFATFLLSILAFRVLYLTYESRFSRYFISSQQEKINTLRSFIAQIPQYASSRILKKDMVDQLNEYFNTSDISLWWRGDDNGTNGNPDIPEEQFEQIYQELVEGAPKVWSRNKEIAPFRLSPFLEEMVGKSQFSLICPLNVSDEEYALLMLGKKRRGVYNLSDLELISQLIQQTQLTLSVLQYMNREKELIQQKYEADLMALRSQINPHFLFNTLNSLTELVHESPERAEDAIEKLSYIFRYTTKESNKNLVPLKNEIKLISTYLELEKIRFGDRLNFRIDVRPEVSDVEIPAFVLQTLVENCIKHGVSKILYDGKVEIDAYKGEEGELLVVEVRDNGPGIDMDRIYKSTGLSNTIKRFENIYSTRNLLYFENTGEGTLVRFKVPMKTFERLK